MGAHGHDHGHGHSHTPRDFGPRFALGIGLNLGFVALEAAYGFVAGSMALLADAGHNLSDVLGLALAWGAAHLARRAPSARYSYGLGSGSILAALLNALLLVAAVGAIAWEAIGRFATPEPVQAGAVMVVAGVGILVNAGTALLFIGGRDSDLNVRAAFLHMAADALVSLGVVVGGALILWTGRAWIDPLIGLVVAAVILWSTWDILRQSLGLALQGVPRGIDSSEVRAAILAAPGVEGVRHLHVWALSTTRTALTARLHMPGGYPGDAAIEALEHDLHDRFGIDHCTLQVVTRTAGDDREGVRG